MLFSLIGASAEALTGCNSSNDKPADQSPAPPGDGRPDQSFARPTIKFTSFGVMSPTPSTEDARWLEALTPYLKQQESEFSACFTSEDSAAELAVRLRFHVQSTGMPADLEIDGGSAEERECARFLVEQWELPVGGDDISQLEVVGTRSKRPTRLLPPPGRHRKPTPP